MSAGDVFAAAAIAALVLLGLLWPVEPDWYAPRERDADDQ